MSLQLPLTTHERDLLIARLEQDLLDGYDEEFELEIEDKDHARVDGGHQAEGALPRSVYFKELFRLQRELVKLQDWGVRGQVVLPERVRHEDYLRHPVPESMLVPNRY
jgi:hypothetical protein